MSVPNKPGRPRLFKAGIILLVISALVYASLLAVPFLKMSKSGKVGLTTGIIIAGEIFFWVGGIFVGKELLSKIMGKFKIGRLFGKPQKPVQRVVIELLVNPFCLCERDYDALVGIAGKYGLSFITYNPWDIEDKNLPGLPRHISDLISGRREGRLPCSVYNDVFVDGVRVFVDRQEKSYEDIEALIKAGLKA